MSFQEELGLALPNDLPHRPKLIELCSQHLQLIEETNQVMNLTRITDPKEAAIKHVFDSLQTLPRLRSASRILDAGTGAGFPGIPLAIALPETQFVLCESVGKKARFVGQVVENLALKNVVVKAERAEQVLDSERVDIIVARALAPLTKAIPLFAKAAKRGTPVLFYKGPDAESEIREAWPLLGRHALRAAIVARYELPEASGERTLLELSR